MHRAASTIHMLQQPLMYDRKLMTELDSVSIFTTRQKTIQGYDRNFHLIYYFSDVEGDSARLSQQILDKVKQDGEFYFTYNNKDAAVRYDKNSGITAIISTYDEPGQKNLQNLELVLWLCFTGGILISLTSGYFFSKALLKPIKQIADDVNSISAQSLANRIKSNHAKDEWNYLVDTLNELLNRLQEGFEVQRRFISVASHELSTPLTSISSQLEISLQKDRDANAYRETMQSVYQDVRHLSELTQTLLEFAAVSGKSGGIELNTVRIDEVLMRLPREITRSGNDYSVKLEFEELPEDATRLLVFGNEELLFTAIKNIVVNGCKYSAEKSASVSLHIEEENIIIAVKDNGRGIPDNELENIFQPFYRIEENRSITGFGIGLPLVNRIIRIHKGEIKVNSIVGKGSTFFIKLPIASSYL